MRSWFPEIHWAGLQSTIEVWSRPAAPINPITELAASFRDSGPEDEVERALETEHALVSEQAPPPEQAFGPDETPQTTTPAPVAGEFELSADDEAFAPETDLVLDPQPSLERAREVLAKYEFDNPDRALQHLQALATERLSFLSPRRCRHFLAAIAPHLLREIAETPNPEATLSSLVQVADSLGGKRVLWELFSANPWALRMFVRFCAASPYLTGILISNPGMIDELMDALVLNRLPTFEELSLNAKDLCKQAEDLSPILHSFRNSVHLQVGVRDILGKESIQTTHQTLSDTAEVCMHEVINREFEKLAKRRAWLEKMNVSLDDPAAFDETGAKMIRNQLLVFSRWCQVMLREKKCNYINTEYINGCCVYQLRRQT